MLQNWTKYRIPRKNGTTLNIKWTSLLYIILFGSNKLAANKKKFMDFIITLLEFPEMVLTQKYNKLLFWSTKLL